MSGEQEFTEAVRDALVANLREQFEFNYFSDEFLDQGEVFVEGPVDVNDLARAAVAAMVERLVQALAEALDPFYTPPEPFRPDPTKVSGQRESTIGWED